MSSTTSESMTWHADGRSNDGNLRHPADSLAWKDFYSRYPDFASEPRNVRLGLASDGFNPFKTMSSTYSTWPVVLIPYNQAPWISMKQSSFILSMIIPGEKGPGDDIDVYLQPLIEELKQLWDGILTYDATRKQNFHLRAALLWTVNDFPAYANLSGWSTKGRFACPCCAGKTCSNWLKHGKKFSYLGHRRWLEAGHPFRSQKRAFDNTMELREAPLITSRSDILEMLNGCEFSSNEASLWKKRSIFFDLIYWEHNLLRHNLDVLHIEKNVCDNILVTILDMDGKSKDDLNSRLDLVEMGIRPDLHPQLDHNGKRSIPLAVYAMSKKEKEIFCQVLKDVKVPDGFSSNISRCVNVSDRKLYNLKSHDCHVLMHDLLPIALRSSMSKRVTIVIIELCNIFKTLCAKVLKVDELDKLQDRAALALCNLEKVFPPSFFTIMVHLVIHLPLQAKLGGPVSPWWMYPVERFLGKLGAYVLNKRFPEGSIVEGYLAEECMTFCSRYHEGIETRFNRPSRNPGCSENDNGVLYLFESGGEKIGGLYLETYKRSLVINNRSRRPNQRDVDKIFTETFLDWFRQQVKQFESKGQTQNSGVVVTSSTTSYASSRDLNPLEGNLDYYGVLNDIIELYFDEKYRVVLFRCHRADVNSSRGVRKDEFGFTLVNFDRLIHTGDHVVDDPYVFSSQVKQVFYSQDPIERAWHVVVHNTPRDNFYMGGESSNEPRTEFFLSNNGTEPDIDLTTITDRMAVKKAVQCGNVEDRLIELIRNGKVEEVLEFAQKELAPRREENQSFLEELERTVALLAFEDASNCPVGELMDISQRLKTASEVNAAILSSQSLWNVISMMWLMFNSF
ncbi:Transposon, En/Spm-like protein [Corchorus capsularis]|uniref:Transposon, En/Spm-like protein n=1 Tax=Corchorus capsularis TaxID=210143 RepID=A0A1R3JC18_COCAP|nr:Transposon, En/Spm-like protein [Corchorus capsularis]